ncbi:MAG: hypothetical protein U1F43_29630 [Myxococcota bacterium]
MTSSDRETPDDDARDRAFTAQLLSQLGDDAESARDVALGDAFRALPRRRRWWPTLVTALAASVLAALATWLIVRPSGHEMAGFDGGGAVDARDHGGQALRFDARGRLAASELDGERLVFRSGRLVRIEHGPLGALDGTAVDFDGAGRVVRIESWTHGALTATQEVP